MDLATELQSLYKRFGHLPGVYFELHRNLIALSLKTPQADALIFVQGAQVCQFQPKGEPPVLWLSEHNQYQEGQPLRGGIPISWPWFADLSKNPAVISGQLAATDSAAAHGFVRNGHWQLANIELDGELYRVTLTFEPDPSAWPFACALQLCVTIGRQLQLALTVKNFDEQPFHYALALHSYFNISNIDLVRVEGLTGKDYVDCLLEWQLDQQNDALTIAQEVDRIFPDLNGEVALVDCGFKRTIRLQSEGLPSLVVWNPWRDKGARLSQFGEGDYQQMLCLESGALLDNIATCAPASDRYHSLVITTA